MARQTLTMALELTGTSKVEGDLNSVAKTADKAFAEITKAATAAGLSFDRRLGLAIVAVRTRLAALQAAGVRLGQAFTAFTRSVNAFGTAIANSAKKIGLITAAISGAVGATLLFAKSTAANSERIDNQAKSLGVSVEAYQNFENAAKNAGLEQGAFDQILQRFVVNAAEAGDTAGDASKKTTDLAKSLRQVEVTAEDGSKKLVTVRGTSENFAKALTKISVAGKGGEKDLIEFAKKVTALGTAQERLNAVLAAGFSKKQAAATVTFLRALANDADDASRALSKTIAPLSQLEIAVGVDLDNAFDRFGTNLTRTKDRLFTLFGPALTKAVNDFADLIFDNKAVIEEWAAFIRDKAVAIVKDFFNALAGNDAAVQNKSILAFRDGVIEFGQAIKTVVLDIVIPAFNQMMAILDGVAAGINKVFGTDLTGKEILVAAVVAQILGAFKLFGAGIAVVLGGIKLFKDALGFIGTALGLFGRAVLAVVAGIAGVLGLPVEITAAIIVAIALAAAAIYKYWDEIVAAADTAWAAIKSGVADAFESVKNIAGDAVRYVGGLITDILTKIRNAARAVSDFFSQDSAGESGGGGGFAAGGRVRGAGSGTSDSILARLSNGEFVIRAASVNRDTLPILHAINSGRANFNDFIQRLQGFDLGGLVSGMNSRLAPRFAGGGLVAERSGGPTGRPVTVNFGGESFEMSASEGVVRQLVRAATGKQIRSNGRKPAWYGA